MKVIGCLVAAIALLSLATTGCGGSGKSSAQQASDILNQGLQAHVDGRIDEAAADYREVLKKDPNNKFAYYNLGVIDQAASRDASAENNYRLALNLDSEYGPALYNLAILRAKAGSTQEAMDLYRHAIVVDDTDASAHYNLGLLLRSAGQVAAGDLEVSKARGLDATLPPPPALATEAGATAVATAATSAATPTR